MYQIRLILTIRFTGSATASPSPEVPSPHPGTGIPTAEPFQPQFGGIQTTFQFPFIRISLKTGRADSRLSFNAALIKTGFGSGAVIMPFAVNVFFVKNADQVRTI